MAAVDGEQKPRGGKEFNWAVKYQPKTLKDFIICHRDIAEKLETSVTNGVGDHFIIEGPPGVGKRTLALAMLREKLGVDILETRLEFKTFIMENASKGGLCSSIQFPVQASSEHKELNLSGLKEYAADGVVMLIEKVETGLVKQQSLHQHQQLFFTRQKMFQNIPNSISEASWKIAEVIMSSSSVAMIFLSFKISVLSEELLGFIHLQIQRLLKS